MASNAIAASRIAARRQAIRKAIEHFETNRVGIRRDCSRYNSFRRRIEQSLRPTTTAKAIVKNLNKANLRTNDRASISTVPAHSDVQELRVKLIRAHRWLDPQVRAILDRLNIKAATGELLVDDVENAAEITGTFKHTVRADWRKSERAAETA